MPKRESKVIYLCKSSDGSITYTYDDQFIYAQAKDGIRRLDLFDKHYYKLRVFDGVPVLEIDGLRMQLVRDFETPLDYAKEVIKELKIPKSGSFSVLDTCMGLGYTASEASRQSGVKTVTTCEFSDAVLTLAKWNPFSSQLFKLNGKIKVLCGDSFDLIKDFESNSFDFVIHDPPRISHAPQLYSIEFYEQLYRVSKPGAHLFHYVGSVGKARGKDISSHTMSNLRSADFVSMIYVPRLQGILFKKPK
ncbi:methyltransferase domain-containing protein [Candidatus Micrarchaeota archaeon]|nr:methyltransferase domain-containing protein [Candidatus Micrarchaeota archaeon]